MLSLLRIAIRFTPRQEVPPAWLKALRLRLLELFIQHPFTAMFSCVVHRCASRSVLSNPSRSSDTQRNLHLNLATFAFLLAFQSNHARIKNLMWIPPANDLNISYDAKENHGRDKKFGAASWQVAENIRESMMHDAPSDSTTGLLQHDRTLSTASGSERTGKTRKE